MLNNLNIALTIIVFRASGWFSSIVIMISQALDSNICFPLSSIGLDGGWFSRLEIFAWVQASAPSGPLRDIRSRP